MKFDDIFNKVMSSTSISEGKSMCECCDCEQQDCTCSKNCKHCTCHSQSKED